MFGSPQSFSRTRIYRIDADEIEYQYIKIQKYIFLCFFLIFIYWCLINVVLSSRQPFLLLVIIPRLRLGIYKAGGTAVWKTVPTRAGFTCSSLRDDHKCSKSITDNALMSLATKIMFWCKKWLEYLDKPMSISIFAPTNIFTARRQQILDTLWKWEKHGKTDSQHSWWRASGGWV